VAQVKRTSQKIKEFEEHFQELLKDKWQFIPDLKGRVSQLTRIIDNKCAIGRELVSCRFKGRIQF
jgi:hypothetical protein